MGYSRYNYIVNGVYKNYNPPVQCGAPSCKLVCKVVCKPHEYYGYTYYILYLLEL